MHDFVKNAEEASELKARLLSFGPRASAILVDTDHGMFAVDPEDRWVGSTLLHAGSFAEHEYLLARSLINQASHVLVVGAHLGAHVIRLSRDCRSLTAIEANPNTFKLLKLNVLMNERTNVVLHNVGASDQYETIKFLMNRENSGGSKRMPAALHHYYVYDNPETIEIPAAPLDLLLGDHEFDLVFMDIEGSEYFALKGMQRLLSKAKALSIEFLPHHIIDVANVSIDEFSATFMHHFRWMYIPGRDHFFEGPAMTGQLRTMFETGDAHDGIYFFKDLDPSWLAARGLPAPYENS